MQERVAQLDYRNKDFSVIRHLKSKVEEQLRRMAGDIVSIRVAESKKDIAPFSNGEIVGIRYLADPDDYSSVTGIKLSGAGGCII